MFFSTGKPSDDWRFFPPEPESPSYKQKQKKMSSNKMVRENSVELTRVTQLSNDFPASQNQLLPPPNGRAVGNGVNPDYEALNKLEPLKERRKHSYTVIQFPNNNTAEENEEIKTNNHSLVVNHRPLVTAVPKTESIEEEDEETEEEEPVYAQIIKRRPTDLSSTSSANLSVTSPYDNVEIGMVQQTDATGADNDDVFNGEAVYQALSECQSAPVRQDDECNNLTDTIQSNNSDVRRADQTSEDEAGEENPYDGIWMTTSSIRSVNNNTIKSVAPVHTPPGSIKIDNDNKKQANGSIMSNGHAIKQNEHSSPLNGRVGLQNGHATPQNGHASLKNRHASLGENTDTSLESTTDSSQDIDMNTLQIMSSAKACDEIVLQVG